MSKEDKRRGIRPSHVDPSLTVAVQTRIPGWLKNDLLDFSNDNGLTLNESVAMVLKTFIEEDRKIPAPPPAAAPVPTLRDVLKEYHEHAGDSLVGPCGQPWNGGCNYQECGVKRIDNVEFCVSCGIRTK